MLSLFNQCLFSQNMSLGVPSEPRITGVTAGVNMFTLTVQLYAGHSSSVYFNLAIVDVPNNNMMSRVENLQPEESISSGLMEYTIAVPFSQRGPRHFIVTVRNVFGSSMESEIYPSMGMIGVEGIVNGFVCAMKRQYL